MPKYEFILVILGAGHRSAELVEALIVVDEFNGTKNTEINIVINNTK